MLVICTRPPLQDLLALRRQSARAPCWFARFGTALAGAATGWRTSRRQVRALFLEQQAQTFTCMGTTTGISKCCEFNVRIWSNDGACAHYVMVSKFQWQPFWLATQRDAQNDWTATQNRVNYCKVTNFRPVLIFVLSYF